MSATTDNSPSTVRERTLPRFAKAIYKRTSLPFRVTFDILRYLRSSRNPKCLELEETDGYIEIHKGHWFTAQWTHAFDRVYSLVNHYHPHADPATLKHLSLGPRTEIEFYYLWLFFGFSWENLTGVDLVSPTPNIKLGDMSKKLPFPDDTFDTILASNSLEKSRDPARTRDEIKRVAKPGARILVCGNRPVQKSVNTPIYTINPFENGAYGFIKHYGVRLEDIEYMNALSPHGFEIIFKLKK